MSIHTFESMGTTVSIRLAHDRDDEPRAEQALAEVRGAFDTLDRRFSLYDDDSELSRIARGAAALTGAGDAVLGVYADALAWRDRTNGAFTPHRPDGVLDLSGLVKALAIERAGQVLAGHEFGVFSVNAGGDILTSGVPRQGAWITGIVDPANRAAMLTAVRLTPGLPAMATSGTAERGGHIWQRPGTDRSFRQATVIAADIVTADVLATAIISGGRATLDLVTDTFPVAVLVELDDGTLLGTPLFRGLVAGDEAGRETASET